MKGYIPHPLEVVTRLDRIQVTKDGWLRLWDSDHPEARIEVQVDPTADNRIEGLAFSGLGEDGEGLHATSMTDAAELITGNQGDDSDWLHVEPPTEEPLP